MSDSRKAVRVSICDESYDTWYRVNGAATDDEAVAAAAEAWLQDDRRWSDEDDAPRFVVHESGWYRCIPCICGDGHRYDLWPAAENERGAFHARLIAMEGTL